MIETPPGMRPSSSRTSTADNNPTYRVCMITDDFRPAATGVGVHVQKIVQHLAQRGHEISVITSRRKGEPKLELWEGARIYRTFTVKLFGFYQALPSNSTLKRILADVKPIIIHYHYLSFLLLKVLRLTRKQKVGKIYTYNMTVDHLTQPLPMRPFRPIIRRVIASTCNKFDVVTVPSAGLISDLRNEGISTTIRYVSNATALEEDEVTGPMSEGDKFVVLYVGRLDPEKNVPYLIRAFAKFAQVEPASELRIAGRGSQRDQLAKLCDDLGVAEMVKFVGFLEHTELSRLYASSSVFVLPSLVETQGMVAVEAMQFAKPIIVTNCIVSADELVTDGENGFIVNPNSTDELCERLVRLKKDAALREKMGNRGLERSKRFGIEQIIDQFEDIYASIV